jgi:hypothetical protein
MPSNTTLVVLDSIIPICKILSIHNGMDPNDSNLKFKKVPCTIAKMLEIRMSDRVNVATQQFYRRHKIVNHRVLNHIIHKSYVPRYFS